ncbi:MAG: RyR domain-containing protein [Bacteroides sp.]|nr:RyR domain-containing protein [Bacteroides sp.]
MDKTHYIPQPVSTDGVMLDDSVMKLSEKLAEEVHEVWAKARMDEGWTYGPVRNSYLKEHPCLVPYQELPEEEKEYDRRTALHTLKLIRKWGFTIQEECNE